jgi:hypothetical protein
MDECKRMMCDKNIYSLSDWRRAMLNKKKELISSGFPQFDSHPDYKRLTECKQDEFDDEVQCNTYKPKKAKSSKKSTKKRCANGTRYNKKSEMCEGSVRKRCSKGTKRNKANECVPK